ncbi:MAG: ATP-binding protein, partial [Holophagales bacterium]|nr:ATP-binding protein [Holophagales bacterium]
MSPRVAAHSETQSPPAARAKGPGFLRKAWIGGGVCIAVWLVLAPPAGWSARGLGLAVLGAAVLAGVVFRRLEARLTTARAEKQQAETELAAALRVRSDLLAGLAHELRAPIHAVLGLVDVALGASGTSGAGGGKLDGGPDLEGRARLDLIRRASHQQLRLVDDILDFARLEAGSLSLSAVDFSPHEAAGECLRWLSPKASAKGLEARLVVGPGVPESVSGDVDRWRQVLLNLLDNAIKYTRRGEVEITLAYSAGRLLCRVRDTGVGLFRADRERLFAPFSRADTTLARSSGGVGLGLAICRRLTSLMGGELGCESERGQGSVFWFGVPLELSDVLGQPAEPEPREVERPRPSTRVLVVDDDEASRLVATSYLLALGCDVGTAHDGYEALDRLEAGSWDVVLMDCRMPGMDGEQTAAEIRRREKHSSRRFTLIAVTADAASGGRQRRLAAGFDDVLPKPFDREGLARGLGRWVPMGEGPGQGAAAGPGAPPSLADREVLAALWRLGRETGRDELDQAIRSLEETARGCSAA